MVVLGRWAVSHERGTPVGYMREAFLDGLVPERLSVMAWYLVFGVWCLVLARWCLVLGFWVSGFWGVGGRRDRNLFSLSRLSRVV